MNDAVGQLLGNDGAIASIQVVATVGGRFDDRLAATGSELFSATDLVLTTWDAGSEVPTVIGELRTDGPRPGPLVAEGGRVVWGAALIGSADSTNDQQVRAAVPELGEAAPRHFRLRFGAASLDGRQVLLYVERVEPRAKAGRLPEPPGPRWRWVIADAGLTSVALSRDEAITTARWDGSTALVSTSVMGRLSSFVLWSPDGAQTLTLEDGTAARSLVPMGDGRWVAGMASGHVVTFTEGGTEADVAAHSRPVTALAYHRGSSLLASGGEDGRILVTRHSGSSCDLDTGQPVEALAWASNGALVAKIGGADGRLLVTRPG